MSQILSNFKANIFFLATLVSRVFLQTLVVVPGKHASVFGIVGGITIGWLSSRSSNRKTIDCINFAILGALYSFCAALISKHIEVRFISSMLIGFSWVILELQARYDEKILQIKNDNILFSISAITYSLLGLIPFIGTAIFSIMIRLNNFFFQKRTVAAQQKINN